MSQGEPIRGDGASRVPSSIQRALRHFPLRIRTCEWTDPTLTITGVTVDGVHWALSMTCPWRVVTR